MSQRRLSEAEMQAIERGEVKTGRRRTPEDIAALRKQIGKRVRRAKEHASDFGVPIDYQHDEVSRHTSPFFTITHNDYWCQNCHAGWMRCVESVADEGTAREAHKKVWRCEVCRVLLTGHYNLYCIAEEP